MKVLIVEDEPLLAGSLAKGLRAEGCALMLPGLSGSEVLEQIRSHQVWTPVLVLTAKDEDDDQVKAFDLGADDYLTKPFSFNILVARLRALVRRGAQQRPVVLTAGTLSLDPARRSVQRGSTEIDLTPREYSLLEFLMRHQDTALTKTDILRGVWASQPGGGYHTVEIYIGYLRRKIDIPFGTNTIQTIRGVGYRLESGAFTASH